MKHSPTFLTIFFLLIAHLSLKSQSLCGYWAGYGYQCFKINVDGSTTFFNLPYELIYIAQVQDTLVAMKIIGDDCVTSGFPTWKALLKKDEKNIKGTIYLGNPLQPNSSFSPIQLYIYSPDSIFIWGNPLTYKKLTCEQAQKLGADLSDTRYNCDCDNTQPCVISMPNAFTPNNDGLNDSFAPITTCQFKTYEFKIFNRLGNLVFFTNDITEEWKGRIVANALTSDVYVWSINAIALNGKVIKQSGEVILIR